MGLGQHETLEVSGLIVSPNPERCTWFRALPDLCVEIVLRRLETQPLWTHLHPAYLESPGMPGARRFDSGGSGRFQNKCFLIDKSARKGRKKRRSKR
jgi:hypothetical protein